MQSCKIEQDKTFPLHSSLLIIIDHLFNNMHTIFIGLNKCLAFHNNVSDPSTSTAVSNLSYKQPCPPHFVPLLYQTHPIQLISSLVETARPELGVSDKGETQKMQRRVLAGQV